MLGTYLWACCIITLGCPSPIATYQGLSSKCFFPSPHRSIGRPFPHWIYSPSMNQISSQYCAHLQERFPISFSSCLTSPPALQLEIVRKDSNFSTYIYQRVVDLIKSYLPYVSHITNNNSWCLYNTLCTIILSTLHILTHLIIIIILKCRNYQFHSHFTDTENYVRKAVENA